MHCTKITSMCIKGICIFSYSSLLLPNLVSFVVRNGQRTFVRATSIRCEMGVRLMDFI